MRAESKDPFLIPIRAFGMLENKKKNPKGVTFDSALPRSGQGPDNFEGKAFGVLTHKLLEKGWDWNQALLEKAALAWAPGLNLPEEKAREAAQMAVQALGQELLQRAKKSPHAFRELPLSGKTSSGEFLNAIVDLAFLEGDDWVVVDYKTDRDIEKEKEKYTRQLGYYAELLTRFTNRKVKETYLYFLKHNKVELI